MVKVIKARPHKNTNAVDLHCHSTFSLLDGMGKPEAVVERAVELSWPAVALTEHGWMASAPILYKAAKEAGIKPVLGCELYVTPDDWLGVQDTRARNKSFHLTVLALSAEGYHNLVAWTTFANRRDNEYQNYYHKPRISLSAMFDLAPYDLHHNVVFSGCLSGELLRFMLSPDTNGDLWPGALVYVRMMKELFPNFYLEFQNHRIDKFIAQGFTHYDELIEKEARVHKLLLELHRLTGVPCVVTNDSHMQHSKQRKPHLSMKATMWRRGQSEGEMEGVSSGQISKALQEYGYFGCVTPDTKILKANLKWVEARYLREGDELLAFDESLSGIQGDAGRTRARRLRYAVVECADRKIMQCYEVKFKSGRSVVVSENHPWLAKRYLNPDAGNMEWVLTNQLRPGIKVPRYFNIWKTLKTYDAGWLAGICDGEGHYSNKDRIRIAQRSGVILEKIKHTVANLGYDYSNGNNNSGCCLVNIRGGLSETIEFLGSVRPVRLLAAADFAGCSLVKIELDEIQSCKPCGKRQVVTLQTSTRTYFADGYGAHNSYMRPIENVADGLPTAIREAALENVKDIAREVDINLSVLDKFKYSIPFSGYKDPIERIRKRSRKRLAKLAELYGIAAQERFDHELSAMGDFAHYLLLMSDFIRNAKSQGILTHTRGSAANSILCYCLGVHDIDSMHYGLTFERFYNPSRKKLPDIDIDIDPDRYEDFIRFVKERMDELEGEGQVVQICNYGTLANRSAFRMVAESQGIPKETIDEISKLLPQMIDSGLIEEGEFDSAFEILKEDYPDVYELTAGVFDSIKSISQHACAWLLGTKERPIADWVPLCLIASSNTLVTQYNYKLLDKYFGLTKADFLRLKTLSVIRETMESMGLGLDKEVIPLDDPETYKMLAAGDTEGVHSMQGRTQRQGCIDVQPENVFDLIAIQALYRPSGTRTGFDKEFVARRRGKKKIKKIHPLVDKVLAQTYGLPIYQEETLDIGYALGMNHSEVQQLLDAIKMAKGVGRGAAEAFEALWPMFWKHAKVVGLSRDKAEEVWKLIDAFQGYGFNKGHATSYAILAAQTGYLKRHGAHGFWASLMNKYPEKVKYVAAAKNAGFDFVAPDINLSMAGFSRGEKDTIRVGLARIKGLGPTTIKEIVEGQPFASVSDLKKRTSTRALTSARLQILAALGALDSLGVERPAEYIFERKEKGKTYKITLDTPELIELFFLGLLLNKPVAMNDVRPLHTVKQDTGEWKHLGLQHGVELTEGPTSVSKLFWIPPLPKSGKWGIYQKKASVWAKVKTNLLTAVDENGIVFEIRANEDKPDKVAILDFLASKCRGAVICLDGAVRQPLLFDGPLTFQLFNVTGVYKDDPQLYNHPEVDDYRSALLLLRKKSQRAKYG